MSMLTTQNQTPLQSKAPEANDKVSRSIGLSEKRRKAQLGINKRNTRTISPKRLPIKKTKNVEKLAALDKEVNSKMRWRNIENEMKQKDHEMELHRLEEELTLKLKYKKEALDARDSCSDVFSALSIRSRSLFNWKS